MNCPFCRGSSKVVDSRPISEGIRRRRECERCGRRFTTHERIVPLEIRVLKANGRPLEEFQPAKIAAVLRKVCKGRPVSEGQIDDLVREIEAHLGAGGQTSVASSELARLLADLLQEVDDVARFRFLANYTDPDGQVVLGQSREKDSRLSIRQMDLF